MNYLKILIIFLLFSSTALEAFYLKRAKIPAKSFTKKHVFKNLSRLKKRLFHYFFSPKIKKTIYKKPQILKNVMLYGKQGIQHKKSLNLNISLKRYYQSSGDYAKVKDSASFLYTQTKSLEDLRRFFEKIIQDTAVEPIKDMNFTMKEVTKTLEREQIAQEQQKFVAYHAMPAPIFLLLSVYTKLYDILHNQITPKHFIYLRTFESISNKNELENFLQGHFLDPFLFNDYHSVGQKHLFSLAPFLFQTEEGESAFNRDAPYFQVVANLLSDISKLLQLDPIKIRNELEKFNVFGKNIFLQIGFEENKSGQGYVGSAENSIPSFQNLYWSGPGGLQASHVLQTGKYKYNGPEMFQKMLKGEKTPAADIAQLRLLITPEYLKEKKYRVHIVNINNQFQDFEQKVNELTELILKESKKSPQKTD